MCSVAKDALREQVDLLRRAWLKFGYNDDVTVRLFNGLIEIRKEELLNEPPSVEELNALTTRIGGKRATGAA